MTARLPAQYLTPRFALVIEEQSPEDAEAGVYYCTPVETYAEIITKIYHRIGPDAQAVYVIDSRENSSAYDISAEYAKHCLKQLLGRFNSFDDDFAYPILLRHIPDLNEQIVAHRRARQAGR